MAKPCRNSRFIGPSVEHHVVTPDGVSHTITETPFELVPAYGQNSLDRAPIQGYDTDMQNDQVEMTFTVPNPEVRRWISAPSNPQCALSHFVSNAKAKERLSRAVYAAWGRENHCCSDQSFALFGPSSAGKTTLARLFGQAVTLPFIEIQPKSIKDSAELFQAVSNQLENTVIPFDNGVFSLKMVRPNPAETNDCTMLVPPCVIFIDEVHALSRNLVPELLKAVEPHDGMMSIGEGWYADCRKVCWVIATTERGLLFPPFENRFRKVHLEMYGSEEIAEIVHLNYPSWNMPLCHLVAKYASRVPREALAFAADMNLEALKDGSSDWKNIAARVARSHGIDRYGLTRQRLNFLVALGQVGATSKGRMADFAGCGLEELEKFVMPALLVATTDDPAMVAVTTHGYQITWQGIAELDRRGIPHRGAEVVADGGEKLDFGTWDSDVDDNYPQPLLPPSYEPKGFSDLVNRLAAALRR